MKKEINIIDYAGQIMKGVKGGVLLSTKADGRTNTMAISWGTLGIEWNKPIFTTFVREGRFTRELLDKSDEFTISIPTKDSNKKLIGLCGSKSGRDVNKAESFGLTYINGEKVSVPAVREFPLVLECRVIYKQPQDKSAMQKDDIAAFYPEDVGSENCGANRDTHIAYTGEIVASYIIED